MSLVAIGIDPGLEGALVVIHGEELEFFDTPVYQDGKRRRIDSAAAATLLSKIKFDCADADVRIMVTIEKSQPMPKNGSIGCFGLGYSYGVWVGILTALEIPYSVVTSQAWKKALMPGEPKEKDASRIVARRMWPAQTEEALSRKKDHGRSDALLIAEFGRRKSGVLDE